MVAARPALMTTTAHCRARSPGDHVPSSRQITFAPTGGPDGGHGFGPARHQRDDRELVASLHAQGTLVAVATDVGFGLRHGERGQYVAACPAARYQEPHRQSRQAVALDSAIPFRNFFDLLSFSEILAEVASICNCGESRLRPRRSSSSRRT